MKKEKKNSGFFHTICTVLVTLLIASVLFVLAYGWRILGFSSHSVSYSSGDTGVIGTLPEKRQFEAGDEVVIRSGAFSKENCKFLGWKDVNNVIEENAEIYVVGSVFIMPKSDVILEAVWEEETKDAETSETKELSEDSDESENVIVYRKKDGKDYINVRNTYSSDSEIVTKITDSDTRIEYLGEMKSVYDSDDETTYVWYYVNIPEKDETGWIRSDMLTEASASKKVSANDTFVKASKYDTISMYNDADSSSYVIEKIDDGEILLVFKGETDKSLDKKGETTIWYLMKDTETGKTGWIDSDKLEQIEE